MLKNKAQLVIIIKILGWSVYSWKDDDDGLVYAQLYDAYGNDVLLFRVNH